MAIKTSPLRGTGFATSSTTSDSGPPTARLSTAFMLGLRRRSRDRGAAVDDDSLSRHERAGARGEEDRGAGDLVGFADAAERRAFVGRFQGRGVFPERAREVGLDQAGRDAIDA